MRLRRALALTSCIAAACGANGDDDAPSVDAAPPGPPDAGYEMRVWVDNRQLDPGAEVFLGGEPLTSLAPGVPIKLERVLRYASYDEARLESLTLEIRVGGMPTSVVPLEMDRCSDQCGPTSGCTWGTVLHSSFLDFHADGQYLDGPVCWECAGDANHTATCL